MINEDKWPNNEQGGTLGYLENKNKELLADYRTPDGNYTESCALIARDIARSLLSEGKQPSIVSIMNKKVNECLVPLKYAGRVEWGSHIVCVCDGLVYDPIISTPLAMDDYIKEVFGVDVSVRTVVAEDEIAEFVKKRE